jgi:methylmalonyl-CoA mutase N-terminal domain/subunit
MLEGVLMGIESNWFQSEIAEAAYTFQRELMSGRRVQVGVNQFTEEDDNTEVRLQAIGASAEQSQCRRLAELRRQRSSGAVDAALAEVRHAAADPTVNLMPATIAAVGASATIGEIMAALAEVFGRYVERASL